MSDFTRGFHSFATSKSLIQTSQLKPLPSLSFELRRKEFWVKNLSKNLKGLYNSAVQDD